MCARQRTQTWGELLGDSQPRGRGNACSVPNEDESYDEKQVEGKRVRWVPREEAREAFTAKGRAMAGNTPKDDNRVQAEKGNADDRGECAAGLRNEKRADECVGPYTGTQGEISHRAQPERIKHARWATWLDDLGRRSHEEKHAAGDPSNWNTRDHGLAS